MGVDLPPGRWTFPLVGPWWPDPPTFLRTAAEYWKQACVQQQQYSQSLRNQRSTLTAHNQGRTAEDLSARYYQGEQFHLDLAEKYRDKATALNACADQIDALRSRLAQVAAEGNQEIDRILASKEPEPAKLAEIQAVQATCNAKAEVASDCAVNSMLTATQPMLVNEGIHGDARAWAQERGSGIGEVPRPQTISKDDLNPAVGGAGGPGGASSHQGVVGGAQGPGVEGPTPALAGTSGGPSGGGSGGAANGAAAQALPPTSTGLAGGPGTGPVSPGGLSHGGTASPALPSNAQFPGAGGSTMPGMSSMNAPMSPAAPGQGMSPGLGQSFASGMATGQSAGAGPQALSTNAMNAMEGGSPPAGQTPAPAPPPVAPSVPTAGSFLGANAPVDTPPAPADAAAPGSGGATPVAPAVVTGGSWSAPAVPSASGPAGPLPAYGSDLRPPVAAPPTMPSGPVGPVSGAAVAPSPGSSPSAGGPLVSPVERAAQGAAPGQAGTGASTMAGASSASAATGATAGATSSRAVEEQRLQRIVDAVARQEPRLSWAAGLRDDGTTTLLVTDLAGGWIPPHVRLPAYVTLLEPSTRRRDASAVELLGAVVVAAAHHPNAYVGEPGTEEPPLTGDRLARSAAPHVDELGPTLVEAVRRRDGLPRIAQAVAAPAVRKTGVLENEDQLLRECIADIQHTVLNTYPHHDLAVVVDWMLLAAIEALIDEHEFLANYHMAWFEVSTGQGGP
nr:DUF5631 domain-containing protein [Mycobacterium sp. 852014-50255_SCH5639931]